MMNCILNRDVSYSRAKCQAAEQSDTSLGREVGGYDVGANDAANVLVDQRRHHRRPRRPARAPRPPLVGLSRMYNNAHWASDVVGGAAIGTFSGIKSSVIATVTR